MPKNIAEFKKRRGDNNRFFKQMAESVMTPEAFADRMQQENIERVVKVQLDPMANTISDQLSAEFRVIVREEISRLPDHTAALLGAIANIPSTDVEPVLRAIQNIQMPEVNIPEAKDPDFSEVLSAIGKTEKPRKWKLHHRWNSRGQLVETTAVAED